ncbi:hypothetical protein Slala02_54230 [Streptomyces lavendulae subsp. lavendulae]|nr:hypothetical protein Slala01_07400 [Streptomyces lavendulae subsp. lavendulae]GLX29603.1 hypothetical protein Slala02_54230 [Streptomyces lavendulae subsp. lavendulae]
MQDRVGHVPEEGERDEDDGRRYGRRPESLTGAAPAGEHERQTDARQDGGRYDRPGHPAEPALVRGYDKLCVTVTHDCRPLIGSR